MKKLAATFALASFALFSSACDERLLESVGADRITAPQPTNPPTCPPDYSPQKGPHTLSCQPAEPSWH